MSQPSGMSTADVWSRVQQFARDAKKQKTPVYTLVNRVCNFITDVTENYIARESDDGKEGGEHLHIRRSDIAKLWDQLIANGRVHQSFAHRFASALLHYSLPKLVIQEGAELVLMQSQEEDKFSADILSIVRQDIDATTREALIDARVGQGAFRSQVLKLWEQCCSVTRCKTVEAIRASHIKPWRESSNQERMDANNGLPLTANLDALFDSGLISFEASGKMVISPTMNDVERRILLPDARSLVKQPTAKTAEYLAFHRACVFRK